MNRVGRNFDRGNVTGRRLRTSQTNFCNDLVVESRDSVIMIEEITNASERLTERMTGFLKTDFESFFIEGTVVLHYIRSSLKAPSSIWIVDDRLCGCYNLIRSRKREVTKQAYLGSLLARS